MARSPETLFSRSFFFGGDVYNWGWWYPLAAIVQDWTGGRGLWGVGVVVGVGVNVNVYLPLGRWLGGRGCTVA